MNTMVHAHCEHRTEICVRIPALPKNHTFMLFLLLSDHRVKDYYKDFPPVYTMYELVTKCVKA